MNGLNIGVNLFICCIVTVSIIFFGALVINYCCTSSYTKIITPILITPKTEDTHSIVMDGCLNTYKIYYSDSSNSNIKLLYCKDHNVPCEITVTTYFFGDTGISNVTIPNSEKPESCK